MVAIELENKIESRTNWRKEYTKINKSIETNRCK